MTPADLIARHKGFTPGPWETDSRIPTRVTGPNDRGICSTGGYQTNTVDEVGAIRKRYSAGGVSWETLARQFRVGKRTIGRIVNGETYG